MFYNNRQIKFSNLVLIALGISTCLWSTTWDIFNLIKSSDLFHLLVIAISLLIFLFDFNIKDIQKSTILFLTSFLLINTTYFIIGLFEYYLKEEEIQIILDYFIKQNISIIFCLLFAKYIFHQDNIDKFLKTIVYTYILIFGVLIYVYVFIFQSDYIGTIIDFDFGRSRRNKNTLGVFIVLIFPFILTYIIKKKIYLVGSIYLILYSVMILKIDSSTVVVVTIFQLALYTFLLLKKSYLRGLVILLSLFFIYPNFIAKEISSSSGTFFGSLDFGIGNTYSDFEDIEINRGSYLIANTHRGRLLYSAVDKVKNDFLVGSGTLTFRIRDEIYDGKVRVSGRTETHNSYLSIFVDYGIIGISLYVFFYLFLLIKIIKKKKLKITNYDFSSIIYICSLLIILNFTNIEYTLAIWLLNGICVARAFDEQ